ncbi:resolvase family protein [Frankia sp. EI5c]|uniref:recombinase family protein n=1 Tax=Frankia sp. EI5c TaxID=683316 RepID=UPI0007C2108B|nr:recombinase family protein [Frankia sp. EI5c]OAA27188.1 resolvase family protein [Frankia sp. EI5c]
MAKLNGLRLGLYTRYSELVGGDDALERQDEDGYEFADEHGATIEKVYQEKKSAWKKKTIVLEDGTMISRVIRPDYAELLADLRSGFLDGAIVWDLDRLTRDLRDLEDAIEVVELYRRPIVGPGVDLTTEYGKANARAQAVAANKASADTSRRVRRSHRHRAERGFLSGEAVRSAGRTTSAPWISPKPRSCEKAPAESWPGCRSSICCTSGTTPVSGGPGGRSGPRAAC